MARGRPPREWPLRTPGTESAPGLATVYFDFDAWSVNASNRDLLRANAKLIAVPRSRLMSTRFGESRPAVQGYIEDAWRWNRRSLFLRAERTASR